MKINRRITDNLTIELDLTGHALQMALEDGYTPEEQLESPCEACGDDVGDAKNYHKVLGSDGGYCYVCSHCASQTHRWQEVQSD